MHGDDTAFWLTGTRWPEAPRPRSVCSRQHTLSRGYGEKPMATLQLTRAAHKEWTFHFSPPSGTQGLGTAPKLNDALKHHRAGVWHHDHCLA